MVWFETELAFIFRHKIAEHPSILWRRLSPMFIVLKWELRSEGPGFRCQLGDTFIWGFLSTFQQYLG